MLGSRYVSVKRTFSRSEAQLLADLAVILGQAWFQPRKSDSERLLKEPLRHWSPRWPNGSKPRDIPLQADQKRSPFQDLPRHPPTRTRARTRPTSGQASRGSRVVRRSRSPANGGYFHFQPGEMFVGGGMWMAEKPTLDAFHRAIVDDPDRVKASLEEPGFVKAFGYVRTHDELKRVPPGLPADHPMADYFRWKDIVFGRRLATTR